MRGGGVTTFLPLSQTSPIAFAPPNPSCTPSWGRRTYPEWGNLCSVFPYGCFEEGFSPPAHVCVPSQHSNSQIPLLHLNPRLTRGVQRGTHFCLFIFFFHVGGRRREGGNPSQPLRCRRHVPASAPAPAQCPRGHPRCPTPWEFTSCPLYLGFWVISPPFLGCGGGARRVLAVPPGKVGGNVIPWLLAGLGGTRGQGGGTAGPPRGDLTPSPWGLSRVPLVPFLGGVSILES